MIKRAQQKIDELSAQDIIDMPKKDLFNLTEEWRTDVQNGFR